MVHDPHRVGLGEPDPELMMELVVVGIRRRVVGDAHGSDLTGRRAILEP